MTDVSAQIERQLRLVAIHLVVFSQRASAALGLSATESEFLNLLALESPLTPGRLAAATGLSSGTVTGVLDRLELRGYLRRDRDPNDRRKVVITASPDRLADAGHLFDAHEDALAAALDGCDAAELETVARFLTRLADAAAQHPFVAPGPRPPAG